MTKYSNKNITGNIILKALLSLLFFIISSLSFAEDMRYYDVEIVIIENMTNEARKSENWPLEVNLNQPEKTVQLGEPVLSEWLPQDVDLKSSYKLLKSTNYNLTKEIEKIAESTTQRVIFHTSWRQPGLDKVKSLPVHFKREIPAAPVIENNTVTNTEESSLVIENTQKENSTPSILEGLLRVTLARYLHLEAELTYRQKILTTINSDNPFTLLDVENDRNEIQKQGVIHFKQKRNRIRSNELHYLDHPVLSILVNITQYLKPEETVTTSTIKGSGKKGAVKRK